VIALHIDFKPISQHSIGTTITRFTSRVALSILQYKRQNILLPVLI
jgi:hypothetical protein